MVLLIASAFDLGVVGYDLHGLNEWRGDVPTN
jgi:hypothetical protein